MRCTFINKICGEPGLAYYDIDNCYFFVCGPVELLAKQLLRCLSNCCIVCFDLETSACQLLLFTLRHFIVNCLQDNENDCKNPKFVDEVLMPTLKDMTTRYKVRCVAISLDTSGCSHAITVMVLAS